MRNQKPYYRRITQRKYFLTTEQENTVLKYEKENIARGFTNINSLYNIRKALNRLGDYTKKPFEKMTKEDLIDFFSHLARERGSTTVTTYQIHTRQFFRWLGKEDAISWMKIKRKKKIRSPSDIPSKEEVFKLIKAADNIRNKTVIALLWDSAARIGEISNLKRKDLIYDEFGGYILVDGKTGQRKIRLIDSIPYLKEYLDDFQKEPEDYLFTSRYSHFKGEKTDRMNEGSVYTLIQRLAAKAKIKKVISPHRIRHLKLTSMTKEGYTEMDLRKFAGWSNDSEMPSVYVHLTDKDLDEKILNKHGIKKSDQQEIEDKLLTPLVCINPGCKHKNPASALWCKKCHSPLTTKAIEIAQHKSTVESFAKYEGVDENDMRALKNLIFKLFDKRILDPKDFIKEP